MSSKYSNGISQSKQRSIEQKLSPEDLSAAQRYGRQIATYEQPQSISRGETISPTSALRQEQLAEQQQKQELPGHEL